MYMYVLYVLCLTCIYGCICLYMYYLLPPPTTSLYIIYVITGALCRSYVLCALCTEHLHISTTSTTSTTPTIYGMPLFN